MNKQLMRYTGAGFLFVSILGVLLHFVYEWSGEQFLIGLFSPVNESTWEHMKLLFFPMLLYTIFESIRLRKDYPGILCARTGGILIGLVLIPVIFYTYSGILGKNYLFLDILTFLLSVGYAFFISYRIATHCKLRLRTSYCIIILMLITLLFFLFTYNPPAIGLFQEPVQLMNK